MGLDYITHNGRKYLNHESIGGASLWIRPLAQYYCVGRGLDIGYSKEAWMLPNAVGIEPSIDPQWDAMKLPNQANGELWDYIHSSHCLEHVNRNIYDVLDYWLSKIKAGGILFLYLPHSSQTYWHPSSNRKHIHTLNESEIEMYLNDLGHKVYVSGVDWNHSFVVICEKVDDSVDALHRCADAIRKIDEKEMALKEQNASYIRDGNKITWNDDSPIILKHENIYDEQKEDLKIQIREHVKNMGKQDIIPNGHYPVKESLIYNFDLINKNI